MGNWRHRPPRRFYRQQKPPFSPPRVYNSEPPLDFWQDGIPLWEKKFCSLIGSIPWRKIIDSKKFMYCHSNVLNWDDSAGEDAFQNAKNRFWAEINGLPSDISMPDRELYIDDIDWNPTIDSQLIEELDRVYFAPEEGESDVKVGHQNKRTRNTVSVPLDSRNPDDANKNNLWECNVIQGSQNIENEKQGWNSWDDIANGLKNSNIENDEWGWNDWDETIMKDSNNADNPWDCSVKGNAGINVDAVWGNADSPSDKGWGYNSNKPWGWQQDGKYSDDIYKPRNSNYSQNSGDVKNRGQNDYWRNDKRWKQWGRYDSRPKDEETEKNGSWRGRKGEYRKNEEGYDRYGSDYRNSGHQREYQERGSYWRRGMSNKNQYNP